MRIFTVQRRESFAARLLKMHVYIEDYENPTTKVAGKPCRLLGYIKNGETRTFNIPESACHIYVVAGKPKGYLESELLPLPEGNQPIFVSGQNCFDFFTGTPFRFDNIVNETTYRHRSKNMKKGLWVMLAAILIGLMIGIALGIVVATARNKPIVYEENGISITLPPSFESVENRDFSPYYTNGTCSIAVIRESENSTNLHHLIDYANAVEDLMDDYDKITTSVTPQKGLLYLEYTVKEEDATYCWIVFFYMTPANHYAENASFYRLIMGTSAENYEALRDDFFEWAKTVEVE